MSSPPATPSRCATAFMSGGSRASRTICLTAVLGAASVAAAQPARRPPAAPRPAAEPDPETRAKLDEQAAALADAARKLAEQQQVIDGMSAALADARRDQAALQAAQQQLGEALEAKLEAKLDAERKARLDAEAAARAAPQVPTVRSAWPSLTLSGFVQIDAMARQSSQDELRQSGDLLNQDRVFVRRGRLRATAAYGKVSGFAEVDLNTVNGNQARVSTAEVAYQLTPWLTASIGIPKIPFGFEIGEADTARLFLERSTTERALFPGEYDVGAKLAGGWRFLRYAIAVQNGEPEGEKGPALRDPNQGKDITARVGVDTPIGDRLQLAAGVSLLTGTGFQAGTPATKDTLVWKDLNEDGVVSLNELQVIRGQDATPSENFGRSGEGADLELTLDLAGRGKLTAYGELTVATNLDRTIVLPAPGKTGAGRDFRELGYYAALIYEPAAWSALGVRYDRYDPDADASELRVGNVVPLDQTFSTLSVTGALRTSHGRLILEYDHNTNHSGRTASGVPTNLGDDAVALRAEIQL